MPTQLTMIARSDTDLSSEVLTALEGQLDALAGLCERDGRSTARLFFICLSTLTAGDVGGGAVRSFLECLLGGRAWCTVSGDLTAAQYAAQLLLQRLFDRDLLDGKLLTAGLCRLGGGGADEAAPCYALAAFLRERRGDLSAPAYMEAALGDAGLSPENELSYSDFITALCAGGGWLYRRLAGGRRPVSLPEGHLLPLAGAELLLRLDGERRDAAETMLGRLRRREEHLSLEDLRDRLLKTFIARYAPLAGDTPLPCRDLFLDLLCCLDAAQAEGLLATAPADGSPSVFAPADKLSWEIRTFRAAGGTGLWPWGCGSGWSGRSGSGFGSGRSGSGFGSGRFGSGFGSGRFSSGFGSGRSGFGSGFCAAVGMGAFTQEDLGGAYGLELIDAPIGEEQVIDWLLELLAL